MNTVIHHNHTTRDIKPKGICPACDRYWDKAPGHRHHFELDISTGWRCKCGESRPLDYKGEPAKEKAAPAVLENLKHFADAIKADKEAHPERYELLAVMRDSISWDLAAEEPMRKFADAILAAGYKKYLTFAGSSVLLEVADERERQHAKWGEQNHPNGTGPALVWAYTGPAAYVAETAKAECQRLNAESLVTFADILLEEVAEAFAEGEATKLRAELIQVAAVAVQWVEAIDRRK